MTEVEFLGQCMRLGEDRFYSPNWPYVMFKVRYERWATKKEKAAALELVTKGEATTSDELLDWLAGYWREAFGET